MLNHIIKHFPFIVGAKPNFLGIGAAKSGTTMLSSLLQQHPEIYIPPQKELHYFDGDSINRGDNIIWYFSQFKKNKAVGEYTPSYLLIPTAPDRILKTLGKKVKLIVLLRNPVDRAFSHYCHVKNNWHKQKYRARNYPIENLNFEEAIENETIRLSENKYHIRHLSYFKKGLYADQLEVYFKIFPQNNFYIMLLEDYAQVSHLLIRAYG